MIAFLNRTLCFLFLINFYQYNCQPLMAEPRPHAPFVILSPPKCGTFLIGRVLSLILEVQPKFELTNLGTDQHAIHLAESATGEGSFLVAHNFTKKTLKYLVDEKNYKVIFILRDPRDQLISLLNWMKKGQWSWLKVSSISDQNAQIEEMITGSRFKWQAYEGCIKRYQKKVDGFGKSNLFTTRFEKLVGPQGGGNKQKQVEEIQRLAHFINVSLTFEQAEEISNKVFGNTATFHEGQIGNWKNYFTERHKTLYKKKYKKKLIKLGYERNGDW